MYLDTDVILAALKVDDWLKSDVDIDAIEEPVTCTATVIELQDVMQDEWRRERVTSVAGEVAGAGVELIPLTVPGIVTAGDLRQRYESLGVFDSVHLGAAITHGESIVSTDTLYPETEEIEHADPRDM